MDAGIEVKVEDYDGTYVCLFCGESVRGQPALKCSHCSSNPFHLACVALAHSKYAEVCPTCDRKTVETWGSASGGTAAPSEIIDLRELESEGEGAGEVVALTGNGARAAAVPAVGGTVVADVVGQVARGGRAEAGGSSSGKGKEPAEADDGPKAGGEVGGATSAGAGADGRRGKGKGKGRAGHANPRHFAVFTRGILLYLPCAKKNKKKIQQISYSVYRMVDADHSMTTKGKMNGWAKPQNPQNSVDRSFNGLQLHHKLQARAAMDGHLNVIVQVVQYLPLGH